MWLEPALHMKNVSMSDLFDQILSFLKARLLHRQEHKLQIQEFRMVKNKRLNLILVFALLSSANDGAKLIGNVDHAQIPCVT